MNDIALRAIKTFIQAFFGVFIPELCIVLREDFPVDMSGAAIVFAPMFCAALAAGISATWNFIESKFFTEYIEWSDIVEIDGHPVDFPDHK